MDVEFNSTLSSGAPVEVHASGTISEDGYIDDFEMNVFTPGQPSPEEWASLEVRALTQLRADWKEWVRSGSEDLPQWGQAC